MEESGHDGKANFEMQRIREKYFVGKCSRENDKTEINNEKYGVWDFNRNARIGMDRVR